MLLYAVVPARRVEWRHAVLGGLLAGIGFEVAKRGFAIYLFRVPAYTLIYGAFATIPIFLIWLYLSWVVVLTGAVFTAVLPVFGRKPDRARVPGEELADALGVLGALARAHERGDVLSLNALARAQRLPPDRCEEILVRAATRGWVARTERDGWVLARDPSQIRVADVYRAFVYDADAVGVPPDHLGLSLRDFVRRDRNEERHEDAAVLSPP
jgi:membrane protein